MMEAKVERGSKQCNSGSLSKRKDNERVEDESGRNTGKTTDVYRAVASPRADT